MHRNPTRKDAEGTKRFGFRSRYSYSSFRIHPGSDPAHECIYLAGADCGFKRDEVIADAKGRCQKCGKWTSQLEVHHIAHKNKIERCWCTENLVALCRDCHRGSRGMHVQVKWTPKQQAAQDFRKLYPEEK